MSRLRYRSRRALHSRMPSMMLAWLSASEITASRSSSSVSNSPVLASKQELYRIVSSVPRNSDSAASSRLWISWVPQMKRTDASPYPHSSSAALAAATTRGSSASPR